MNAHEAFGLTMWIGVIVLVLCLHVGPEYNSRAETATFWVAGLMLVAIATGAVGLLVTPGSFWHG